MGTYNEGCAEKPEKKANESKHLQILNATYRLGEVIGRLDDLAEEIQNGLCPETERASRTQVSCQDPSLVGVLDETPGLVMDLSQKIEAITHRIRDLLF